ncbi:MAG: NAD(P)-dependent oxidoreductase [Thermomicrobiales bacterium]|nr:NAD(P)-dependent oxidoreductase [Thermomicrobiales bacterium]
MKVAVTGAAGVIGRAVMELLGDRYELHAITRRPADFPSVVADAADLEAMTAALQGMDAVVHLAASPSVTTPWKDVLHNNIESNYAVYEAARINGVEAIIFASSNHTIGGYELDGLPDIYDLDDPRCYDHHAEIRPDSFYGVAKVFGEALGRYYHETYGLRVYNLRIGSVRADDDPRDPSVAEGSFWLNLTPEQKFDRLRSTWLSKRDCCELIACCLEAKKVGWATVYGISNNPRQFWDLSEAQRLLGFIPQDSAPVE